MNTSNMNIAAKARLLGYDCADCKLAKPCKDYWDEVYDGNKICNKFELKPLIRVPIARVPNIISSSRIYKYEKTDTVN